MNAISKLAFIFSFILKALALIAALQCHASAGIREATVKVRNGDYQNGRKVGERVGSATIVARTNGYVWGIGCGHNFNGIIGGRFTIEAFDGAAVTATLERIDKTADLSLFSAPDYEPLDVFPISSEPTDTHDFTLAGYPSGASFVETTATLQPSKWSDMAKNPLYGFQCSNGMDQGVSGGGAIANGELYGVISAGPANDNRFLLTCSQKTLYDFAEPPVQKCSNGRCILNRIARRRAAVRQARLNTPLLAPPPPMQPAPLRPIPRNDPLPPPPAPYPDAPPAPAPTGTTATDARISALEKKIDALIQAMQNAPPGAAGPPGPAGNTGPPGQQGQPGPPGLIDSATLKAMQDQLNKLTAQAAAGIDVQMYDQNGKVFDSSHFNPGEPLTFQVDPTLVPVQRKPKPPVAPSPVAPPAPAPAP